MKPIRKQPDEPIAAARLYRDDIENIISLLGDDVLISDEECEYDSLDELATRKGSAPSVLYLRGGNLHVRLQRFSANAIYVYSTGADPAAVYAVRDVLEGRRTWFAHIARPRFWWLFVAFVICLSFAQAVGRFVIVAPQALGWMWVIGTLVGFVSLFVASGSGTSIHLVHRHETSSFIGRNAEKLIIAALGAAAGALGKGALDWIAHHFAR